MILFERRANKIDYLRTGSSSGIICYQIHEDSRDYLKYRRLPRGFTLFHEARAAPQKYHYALVDCVSYNHIYKMEMILRALSHVQTSLPAHSLRAAKALDN